MTVFLLVLVVLVVWVASLVVHPFGKCWACGGQGVHARKGHRKAKARKCWLHRAPA